MNVWGALVGGVVGTLVLTSSLRAASELGLTRMDLPFLLGTAVTGTGPELIPMRNSRPGWPSAPFAVRTALRLPSLLQRYCVVMAIPSA